MTETADYDKSATPSAHKTTHQDGGTDEISVGGLDGELAAEQKSAWAKVSGKPTTFTPAAHKSDHQDGGSDELSVEGLTGELTAEQKSAWSKVSGKPTAFTPAAHKTDHQDGGTDEISAEGLAGELTAEQKSAWAKVSGKPTTFTPSAHKTDHQVGGTDALDLTGLTGSVSAASVQAALEQAWTTPAYNSSDFYGSLSMTWTVGSTDVQTFAFIVQGKIMTVAFSLFSTSVGGTPSTIFYIKIPGGKVATKDIYGVVYLSDNGTRCFGFVYVPAGGSVIWIAKVDVSAFAPSANNTGVWGQITFEIN